MAHPAGSNFGANNHFPRSGARAVDGARPWDGGGKIWDPCLRKLFTRSRASGEVVQMNHFPKKWRSLALDLFSVLNNNFQKVTQFGFILFSVLIYYREFINYFLGLVDDTALITRHTRKKQMCEETQ